MSGRRAKSLRRAVYGTALSPRVRHRVTLRGQVFDSGPRWQYQELKRELARRRRAGVSPRLRIR